jgi:uncharacterized protein YjdB
MQTLHTLTIILVAAAAAAACKADDLAAPDNIAGSPREPASPSPGIVVTPRFVTLDLAKSVRLAATLRYPHGMTTLNEVAWRTADRTIATVTADGTVHALRAGRVQIAATWRGSRGSAFVTVRDPVIKKRLPRCIEIRKITAMKGSDPASAGCPEGAQTGAPGKRTPLR